LTKEGHSVYLGGALRETSEWQEQASEENRGKTGVGERRKIEEEKRSEEADALQPKARGEKGSTAFCVMPQRTSLKQPSSVGRSAEIYP